MRLRFLGTGGAPNEARHQASLLVEWGAPSSPTRVLLDTGSGLDTVRLLLAAGCDPAAVSDIFVSHQHLDHLGGLEPLLLWRFVSALRARGRAPGEDTRVHAERRVLARIGHLFAAVDTAVPRLFGDRLRWIEAAETAPVALPEGGRLTAFLVDHEPRDGGAMGCAIEQPGARLVYSGDTRPTGRLIEVSRGAHVLVHEAGGLDTHAAEIHRQGHSTAGDAGRVAAAAQVGRLILTHVPDDRLAEAMLAEARAAFDGPVELARDQTAIDV